MSDDKAIWLREIGIKRIEASRAIAAHDMRDAAGNMLIEAYAFIDLADEIEALRALVDELVVWGDPRKYSISHLLELEPIIARAKALRSEKQ